MGICTKFVLLELQEVLAALHMAGHVVIKRGTLRQFEDWGESVHTLAHPY